MAISEERKRYLAKWRAENRDKCRVASRRYRLKMGANPNYYYSEEEKAYIIALYHNGYSSRKLGEMFGREHGKLREMLKREGVTLRSHAEALALLKKPRDSRKNGWRLQEWSKAVIKRDGKCMNCGSKKDLEAHHLEPKSILPKLMYETSNGMALCHSCHLETDSYAKKSN